MSDKQDKAIKLALASAIAAKKASEMKQIFPNGSPNSSSIRLQKQENGRNEVESKEEKPKICCKMFQVIDMFSICSKKFDAYVAKESRKVLA